MLPHLPFSGSSRKLGWSLTLALAGELGQGHPCLEGRGVQGLIFAQLINDLTLEKYHLVYGFPKCIIRVVASTVPVSAIDKLFYTCQPVF